MKIPIRLADGKAVGVLIGDEAIFSVSRSRHFFLKIGGYSIDAAVIRRLPSDCRWIVFRDAELHQSFKVETSVFRTNAQALDFGFGVKLCASEEHYQAIDVPQLEMFGAGGMMSQGEAAHG